MTAFHGRWPSLRGASAVQGAPACCQSKLQEKGGLQEAPWTCSVVVCYRPLSPLTIFAFRVQCQLAAGGGEKDRALVVCM